MLDIKGRMAIVTGGSRGIGAAASILLAKAGADVVILYGADRSAALDTCREIRRLGRSAMAVRCQVQNYQQCKSAILKVTKNHPRIDILINCAGVWEEGKIGSMKPADWRKTIDINLTGTFNMCNLIVPMMKSRRFGRIVNLSSTAGQRGEPGHSHYAASKGGIIAFTKSIAVELIPHGIRVNCVAPGWVRTDMVARAMRSPRQVREIRRSIPRGRIPLPDEIAGSIVFLASALADHVVGEVLNVNGGSLLCG